MANRKGCTWGYAPDPRRKPSVPDDLKKEVQTKANDLVEKVLKLKYIQPPPKKPEIQLSHRTLDQVARQFLLLRLHVGKPWPQQDCSDV